MLVTDGISSKIQTRCRLGKNMAKEISSGGIMGCRGFCTMTCLDPDVHFIMVTGCFLCGFCESARHVRHVMRGSTAIPAPYRNILQNHNPHRTVRFCKETPHGCSVLHCGKPLKLKSQNILGTYIHGSLLPVSASLTVVAYYTIVEDN